MEMSDSPVSAFSVYKKNLGGKTSTTKHKKKSKSKPSPLSTLKKKKYVIGKVDKFEISNNLIRPDEDTFVIKPVVSLHTKFLKPEKKSTPLNKPTSKSVALQPALLNYHEEPTLTFEWLLSPIKKDEFFNNWWEKSPVIVKRNCTHYYQQLFTTETLDKIIRKNSLFYTQNIDVVSYENGKRETHNQEGRVYPAVLWDYYSNGCSIRVLNPQTFCSKLHSLLDVLQEFFGGMVGVNAYLTPPGSQGFAPHYDDIEAFVLQLEGRKNWNLYAPLSQNEILPRVSSRNFERSELQTPIKQLTLEAGDLLYFPRGIIHEGFTDADSHSLHITVSVYQKTAYIDLLEHAFKTALSTAARLDPEYRKGLPLNYLQHTGFAHSQTTSSTRDEIVNNVKHLITKLTDYISVDTGADQLAKQFMWDAMPPVPTTAEKSCMIHENSDSLQNGIVCNKVSISLDVQVRLFRYHCLCVAPEESTEDTVQIYYSSENAKYYHGLEQQFLVIDKSLVPALKFLIHKYPTFIQVKDIPLDNDQQKMQIVSDLWERGLLVTQRPLKSDDD